MPLEAIRRIALRFTLLALVLGGLAVAAQDGLSALLLPALGTWLGWVDHTYLTVDLSLVSVNGETMIRRIVTPAVTHVLGHTVVYAHTGSRVSTGVSAGLLYQPLVLGYALALAWPASRLGFLARRLLVLTALLCLVLLLDVPLLLYGTLWSQEVTALEPNRISPLSYWVDFMNAGGRFALSAAAVVISVRLGTSKTLRIPGVKSQ